MLLQGCNQLKKFEQEKVETQMKNVNQLVKTVQAEGNESFAYVELFETLSAETIVPKSESYSRQLKGDVDAGISEGYKLIMELVKSWDGTGSFHSLFKTSFDNRLKNLVKHIGRQKRKHNTSYDVSLSGSVERDGEASPILEVIDDSSLHSTFDVTEDKGLLESVFAQFAEKYPEQAAVCEILGSFPDDGKQKEKTEALCNYYGIPVDQYKTVQKKVSRSREAFKKFLVKSNYTQAV
jgi:hypothetical protein